MLTPILFALAGFLLSLIVASFCEWVLHKYIMHRPLGKFRYPFETHAIIHHQTFKADHTYHLVKEDDRHTIPMAWWNGPVLVAIISLPVVALGLLLDRTSLAIGGFIGVAAYYCVYEYIHWCMHLPKSRRIEKPWLFRKLNGHHLLHHRYMHKNFNVVLPLADLVLGTLMKRSKISFKQATGPAVPNVQPLLAPIAVPQQETAGV